MTAALDDRLQEIVQLSLGSTPEDMLRKALDMCIGLSGATGGALLAEEGPNLQFVFADRPELIGVRVPFDSIAGASARRNVVVYTYAPADARHFRGVDARTGHETRFLLSIPIPPVHRASGGGRQASASGALQLLFDRDLMPELSVMGGPREFAIADFREQDLYRLHMRDVFWTLPLVSFGIEVMRLRLTSHQAVHELKNKLIAGQSWIGCLKEDLERKAAGLLKERDIGEDIELCEASVREGANLAKTYLQLAGIYAPAFAEADVNDVLRASAASIRAFAADCGLAGLNVALDLDGGIAAFRMDAGQLKMAFFNLCKNAVEALARSGSPAPELRLSSRADGERSRLAIGDNGPGMPPEIAEHLFEPFRTKKEGGTGLGLTIVKKIVDVHGGTIAVSTGPDGTRWDIVL